MFRRAVLVLALLVSMGQIGLPIGTRISPSRFRYITASGAGAATGTDWANACKGFTGACGGNNLVRDHTYYLASGLYAENVAITKAVSGTRRLTFLKAIPTDHGTEVGWNPAYGVGQAEITPSIAQGFAIAANNGYITIDGQVGSGTSGHGIKIRPLLNRGTTLVIGLFTGNSSNSIHLRHIELEGPGEDRLADGTVFDTSGGATCTRPTPQTCGFNADGVYSVNSTPVSDLQMSDLYIHHFSREPITLFGVNNVIIEKTHLARNHTANGPFGQHGQGIAYTLPPADHVIIRNNTLEDITGSAAVALLGANGLTYSNFYICGNIFYSSDSARYAYSPAAIWGHAGAVLKNVKVFNNSFYSISRPNTWMQGADAGGNETKNNIYANSRFAVGQIGSISTHNYYFNNAGAAVPSGETGQQDGTGSPFVSAPANSSLARTAGVAVPAPCAVDRNGVTRGADGTLDRGALELTVTR